MINWQPRRINKYPPVETDRKHQVWLPPLWYHHRHRSLRQRCRLLLLLLPLQICGGSVLRSQEHAVRGYHLTDNCADPGS